MNIYSPSYETSRAIVIGINKYPSASPLSYAVHDAKGISEVLNNRFGFPKEDITALLDEDATKQNIMRHFMSYVKISAPDDRVVFFFAGHGYTEPGIRREVGFLVPHDGSIDDLSTLIRWDELTLNAELIPAKHILFIMDACYGGLALMRGLTPGSYRFLKDMVQRYGRQVITAGKADEVVSDSGGPIPRHSVFTGHLIEALEGKAETGDGILTANGVMSYVYERVAKDPHSKQTPHYGFLEGDGDFVFKGLPVGDDSSHSRVDDDFLIGVPVSAQGHSAEGDGTESLVTTVKELLAEPKYVIRLEDTINTELRRFLSLTADESFKVKAQWSPDAFRDRVNRYENVCDRLRAAIVCIAYWGRAEHRLCIQKLVSRMTEGLEPKDRLVIWRALRWYPHLLMSYSGGIAAVSAGKYENLATILETKVGSGRSQSDGKSVISSLTDLLKHSYDAFKTIPGHERHYSPLSEYLFKLLQPQLDDLLFLGHEYEAFFDQFEVLFSLVCADKHQDEEGRAWGPPGRFAWKYRGGLVAEHPYRQVIQEADTEKANWGPLRAGLFRGSYERFKEISSAYEGLMKGLNWV